MSAIAAPPLLKPTLPSQPAPAPVVFAPPQPPVDSSFGGLDAIRKITVDEYHRMIQHEILQEGEPVELLEGYLVKKMPRSPDHDNAIMALNELLQELIRKKYLLRPQLAATYSDSEPEPDLLIVHGPRARYNGRHATKEDGLLVIEVASSSLLRDRRDKARIYARAGVPCYWIVNLEARHVEVYTQPVDDGYQHREDFASEVPVVLEGVLVGHIAVAELLPTSPS